MVASMRTTAIELVERDEELARVACLMDEARHGRGGILVLEGEAGIGKSALVEVAVEDARAREMLVLAARGSELERRYAFGLVRQALQRRVAGRDELFAGRAALARAALDLGFASRPPPATDATLDGLYWLLAELADGQPLLLAVDDAHWADEESVGLLRHLAPRIGGLRAAVVAATRRPDVDGPLSGLLADSSVEVRRPRAFGLEGTARQLGIDLGRDPSPDFVTACHAATGGNPFLLAQVADAIRAEEIEPTAENAGRIGELRPQGLARSVLARLDAPTRNLARALAVLGDDAPVGLAAALARMAPDVAERAADTLAAAGVLADRRPLRFRHDLLRGAVLASMPAGEQAIARAAAVAVLRAHDATPERIAAQLLDVEPRRDRAAGPTLTRAAAQACARGAPGTAAALLERALEEPLDCDTRARALMELGAAEQSLGRAEAADRFLEAARMAPHPGQRLAAAIAAAHAAGPEPAQSTQALRLLDELDIPAGDRTLAVRVLNARLAASFSDITRFHAVAAQAHTLGPITGSTPDERRLLAHVARARLETGADAREVAELAARATDGTAVEDPGWFVTVLVALTAVDHFDAAQRLALRALERARERGALRDYLMAMTWRARIALLRGDLEEAEGLARAALEAGAVIDGWWRLSPASVLIEALVDQGRVQAARDAWTATGLGEVVPPQRPLTPLVHGRGRLRLAEGDAAAALEDFREVTRRLGPHSHATIHGVATRLRMAEARRALGEHEEARRESLAAMNIAQRFGAASTLGAALRTHGRLTNASTCCLRRSSDSSSPPRGWNWPGPWSSTARRCGVKAAGASPATRSATATTSPSPAARAV
jgi:tetratricopeptide (TPR) repeat protein